MLCVVCMYVCMFVFMTAAAAAAAHTDMLGSRFKSIMIEGGASIIQSVISSLGTSKALADQIIITIAPVLVSYASCALCHYIQLISTCAVYAYDIGGWTCSLVIVPISWSAAFKCESIKRRDQTKGTVNQNIYLAAWRGRSLLSATVLC